MNMTVSTNDLDVPPDSSVLLLWSSHCSPDDVKSSAETLSHYKLLQLENLDRLHMANLSDSSFDAVVCGIGPPTIPYSESALARVLGLLKPSGKLLLVESVENGNSASVLAKLKLTGYVDSKQCREVESTSGEQTNGVSETQFVFSACKPNYEVGSSSKLKISFSKKSTTQNTNKQPAAQVWSLNSAEMLDDDLELIDESDLLAEEDLKKPDPASLLASCGPGSGKKKACKNCTCGLADELDDQSTGVKLKSKAVTSACGSCYLGDAFRCSSCPYLGMPAFKAGEKIQLTDRQLNPDK